MPPLGSGQPAAIRFWRFVDKRGDDECWLWTGAAVAGYGVLASDELLPSGRRKSVKAHRFSWQLDRRQEIPPKGVICHNCDVPLCVNPRHLFLGTYTDNRQDQIRKRRSPHQKGEWRPAAILTVQQVEEIRPQRGIRPASAVAPDYGVGVQAIYDIWQGKTWAEVR